MQFINRRAAFTLLELLAVVGIISILLGMLLTAISSVTRYSRQTVARAEVKMLENAWKQYLEHYGFWPTNNTFWAAVDTEEPTLPETGQVTGTLAAALEGRRADCDALDFNPDYLALLEFTRYDASGAPINPWGRGNTRYLFRLDISAEGMLSTPPPDIQDVAREVIVWTYDDRGRVIGSWQ